ncbi:hypothetical protein FHS43_002132 [Streptosporangium becharense]|uniref:Uncharacterized protein n=1 Tax=Streptosporangium becharense TaxID=1816182 RepID=A0A7W9IBB0_9ACTN|nr:hypothetical protein [Streptosporangium becharense]MBB2910869.1 hypothetical protein [Streptosporangium becharense]MBB5817564.1 hypothetical protein [Streptosporangium becharense]
MSDPCFPVPELNLLKELQDRFPKEHYAGWFELFDHVDTKYVSGLGHPEFAERLLPFAYATSSGSFYCLWRCDDREDLATLPVIFCGDEGELFIEASSLYELFRLLALDHAHFDDSVNPDNEDECTGGHREYLAWLRDNFGLAAPRSAAEIHEAAFAQYGRPFAEWWMRLSSDYSESVEDMLEELSDRWS